MTLSNLLKENIQVLKKSNIEDAEFDAREIMLNILDMDIAQFLYECDTELEKNYDRNFISRFISNYEDMINARSKHYPLQYIIGEKYFCGLKIELNDKVLIPRNDTETLVEKVLFDYPRNTYSVLDICTGTGCIAIALAKLGGYKIVVGSDISEDCINVAMHNAKNIIDGEDVSDEMNQHIYFVLSDLFDDIKKIDSEIGSFSFDIITANPPYIKTNDINNIPIEVKNYEPRIALDGGKDGLYFYKKISKQAKNYMKDNGKIYLEIGFDQENDVKNIFEKEEYKFIELVKDLGGNSRVLVFSKK